MIDKLPAYPEYRDSGLPWVGTIPAHWNILRNGRLFTHRVETGFPDLPILEVSLRTGVRVRDLVNLKRKQMMTQKEKYKRAVKGDIAYNMMRMWQGALGVVPTDGLVSPAYVVICPFDEVNSAYYDYLFRTGAYMNEVNKFSRGIVSDRNRLYWDEFKQMPSIIPARDEQDKIVAFLRAQDRQIAQFIRDKRRMIELLSEQKLQIIDNAVTRGLDASVKLRPSNVEWLPKLPEHWKLSKVKLLADYINGYAFDPTEWASNGRPIIRIQNLTKPDAPCNYFDDEIPARYLVKTGDILLSWSASLGVFVWHGKDAWLNQHIFKVIPNRAVITHTYFVWLARWFLNHMAAESHGSTMQHVTKPKFGSFPVPLPPIKEQVLIDTYLQVQTSEVDSVISRVKSEIELIREFRERLISDVVTGKVDVRGWTPGPEDLEADDEELVVMSDEEEIPDEENGDAND